MNKIIKFFQESYAELKKVSWPTRDEVASSTKVVVISVVVIATALAFVDFALAKLVDILF
jgi:preprotein translocase subunit SecE